MKLLRSAALAAFALIITLILEVFLSGLMPPFNAIDVVPVALLLIYLMSSLERAYLAALAAGVLQDYAAFRFVGAYSVAYIFALALLAFTRRTVITHENKMTVLLSGIFFFTLFAAAQIAIAWEISYQTVTEMLFRIIVNSALLETGYCAIKKIQREMDKRFL